MLMTRKKNFTTCRISKVRLALPHWTADELMKVLLGFRLRVGHRRGTMGLSHYSPPESILSSSPGQKIKNTKKEKNFT